MATSRARGTANNADVLTDETTVLTVLGSQATEGDKLAKLAAEADYAHALAVRKVNHLKEQVAEAELAVVRASKEAERARRAADKASD